MITRIILHIFILIPILSATIFAQSFQIEWDEINRELDSGKIQSAKPLLTELFVKAKSQKQMPSMLKCILHLAAISGRSNEPDDKSIILTLQRFKDSVTTKPEKAIIDYFIAEALRNYYHYTLEDIRKRPLLDADINDFNQIDIWHQSQFQSAIRNRIKSAIQDSSILLSIPGRTYSELLRVKIGSDMYRPSLYDLIMYSSISLLEKFDQDVERRYRPTITDPRILEIVTTFIQLPATEFVGYDTEYAMIHDRIALYQSLIRNHANDKDQTAFIDANIQRLIGLFPTLSIDAKDSLLINALLMIGNDPLHHPSQANAMMEAVLQCINTDQPGKAYQICNLILEQFPNTNSAEQSKIQLGKIRNKALNLTVQQYILPGKPFIFRSEYANIDKIYCRIYKLSEEVEKKIKKRRYRDTYLDKSGIKQLIDMQPIQAWKQEFPKNEDYRMHSIWKKAPALNKGRYIMLISNSPIFDMSGDNVIVHAEFSVTPIMSLLQKENGGNTLVHIIDAEKGFPLRSTVQIMESTYDQESNTYDDIITDTFSTNADGISIIPPIANENYIRERYFRIISSVDTLIIRNSVNRFPTGEFQSYERLQLFTDRQIYRPGQLIQFKGIAFSQGTLDSASVIRNRDIIVRFVDARSKVLDSLRLRTSEFGSFSSTFKIPEEIVSGFCSIQSDLGSVSFRVEEYKRPSFEITFSKSDKPYLIGDRIYVNGMAKSYAGSGISGAIFKYTVSRITSFPCWFKQWLPLPISRDREIAHGSGNLDKDGNFTINFDAIKDPMLNPFDAPLYSYKVSVDIIAGNGELQQAESIIEVGTLKAVYAFKHKEIYTTKESTDIQLSCTFNNGKPAKGMRGNIIIEALEKSKQLQLPLPFEFGDVEGLSEKDKELLFPNDQCDVYTSQYARKALTTIYTATLTSDDQGIIKPIIPILKPGTYRIRYVSENENIPFTIESTWSILDIESSTMPLDEHLLLFTNETTLKPGDTAHLCIGTAWKDASILMQVESRGKIIQQERYNLSTSIKKLNIPIISKYRGGIAIHVSLVKLNRLITKSMSIMVPWKDKQITIKTKTLRDKTSPGKKEQISFSIESNNKQNEVLGILYDASLDALAPKQFIGIYNLWEPIYAQVQPTGLTINTVNSTALFGDRWNEAGNGFSEIREFDEFNVDLLLGGIFGRTEVLYYSDMLMAKDMMDSPMQSTGRMLNVSGSKSMSEEALSSKQVTPRIAMQETAFFASNVQVNKGEAIIETTMPDALTRWNIRLFSHAKDMSFGFLDTSIVSQKELMITTNIPRFVRYGDTINLRSSLYTLGSASNIKGKATFSYFIDDDSLSIKTIISDFAASKSSPGQVMWNISIPNGHTITMIFSGESDSFDDAERYTIPILPNALSITDRYPIWINPKVNSKKSISLEYAEDIQSLSIQVSSEPYWYALEALPDLLRQSYGSSLDQLNRMLASIFAEKYILSNSSISKILRDSLLNGRLSANLTQSKGLSMSDIGPWESDMIAQDKQAANISIYAEPDKIKRIGESAFDELQKLQLTSGAFPWFPSMSESPYITRQILIGFGIAESISSIRNRNRDAYYLIDRTIDWLDQTFKKDIEQTLKRMSEKDTFSLVFSDIHYCYARSYFLRSHPLPNDENMNMIIKSLWSDRLKHGIQAEAMIALFFNRIGENEKAKAMLRSLKERSIQDQYGIHWSLKTNAWTESDIETHALIVQAFDEIESNNEMSTGILTYMLKQKQTRNWSTPSATLSATMSLLNSAVSCSNNSVLVSIDGKEIKQNNIAFPGLMSSSIKDASTVRNIDMTTDKKCPVWGGVYRHRIVPLKEQFSAAEGEFSIGRQYLRNIPGKGLIPLKDGDQLILGEKIFIRIRISTPTGMNYVQIQDLFPSCLDNMANISEYRHYQNLWAYIIPRDKTMNFFIDYLPKGVSFMDYEMKVDKTGTFSKGMIKAYSIYAPEYGAVNGGGMILSSP
jgi:hypothetical protein